MNEQPDSKDRMSDAEYERKNFYKLFHRSLELVCIFRGSEHTIEMINSAAINILGFDATGISIRKAKPEAVEFHYLLDQAFESGEAKTYSEMCVTMDGRMRCFNFTVSPCTNQFDIVDGVMVIGSEITEQIHLRNQLKEASAMKSDFLANMSHEIRTPLGVIIGFTKLLNDRNVSRTDQENYVKVIERNCHQLLRLVDDILDLSKVESGKMSIEMIDFSLAELLTDFLSAMRVRAGEKKIELRFNMLTSVPRTIKSDPTRIRQILNNAVGNAIKFTDQGYVELNLACHGDQVEFEIKDTGCGIQEESQLNIFQTFRQADPSITRKYGGTGLGLVLTKKVCAALQGEFWLKESHQGKGSIFVAKFKADTSNPNDLISQDEFISPYFSPAKLTGQLKGMRVLLVEDSVDNQDLFTIYLSRQGAEIKLAKDGFEGMEKALAQDFDVVLMDVQMPRMDGITAIQKLRACGYKKPVIALTAHAMKEEKARCLKAGFTDFLSKPFDCEDLIEKIQHQVH